MDDKIEIYPWMEKNFSKREISEINFSRVYALGFAHGTDGHNAKLIISRLASLLNQIHFMNIIDNDDFESMMGYDLKAENEL